MEMEFKLINPDTFVKVIEFNYDDLHKWIEERVEKYQNLIYTDETIKEAKEDRAALNKFKERIDEARKDVKRKYLEPLDKFESKVKTLIALIDKPASAIDTQVKSYEERKKTEKKQQIEEYFNAVIGDLSKFLTLEQIFNSKWLNSTVTIKSVQTEIEQIIAKVKFDLQTIKELKSEWELTLIDTYLKTLDISAALREKTRLEERKKELEELKAKEEAVKQGFTLPDEPVDWEKERGNPSSPYSVIPDYASDSNTSEVQEAAKIYTRKFWVTGTAEQLKALGRYMKENGIEYGGIE